MVATSCVEDSPALTAAHVAVLGWVCEHPPADVEEIADGLGLEVAVVEALCDELERAGLVAGRNVGRTC